jgi:hypothetical protein
MVNQKEWEGCIKEREVKKDVVNDALQYVRKGEGGRVANE